jgi:hypothetical protein
VLIETSFVASVFWKGSKSADALGRFQGSHHASRLIGTASQQKARAMAARDENGQKTLTDGDIATLRYRNRTAGNGSDVDSDAHAPAHTDSDAAAPASSTDSDTSQPARATSKDADAG